MGRSFHTFFENKTKPKLAPRACQGTQGGTRNVRCRQTRDLPFSTHKSVAGTCRRKKVSTTARKVSTLTGPHSHPELLALNMPGATADRKNPPLPPGPGLYIPNGSWVTAKRRVMWSTGRWDPGTLQGGAKKLPREEVNPSRVGTVQVHTHTLQGMQNQAKS